MTDRVYTLENWQKLVFGVTDGTPTDRLDIAFELDQMAHADVEDLIAELVLGQSIG